MSGVSVMGIDPGLGGGLAIIHPHDGVLLEPLPVIGNELDLAELSRMLEFHANDIRVAVLEKVAAMPGQGVSSMFKFGKVYGAIQALLVAHKIAFVDARPQQWMKVMHAGVSQKLESKERSRLVFAQLFPNVDARRTIKCRTPDMGLVEAALMAEYGRREL